MEVCPLDFNLLEFFIGHMNSFWIGVGIKFGFDFQSRSGGRASDQINYYFMAEQRLSPPIHANMTEHPMLNLVPLAGPRRVGCISCTTNRPATETDINAGKHDGQLN